MKKICSLLIAVIMSICVFSAVYGADNISIYVNGNIVQSEVKPVIINGSTFIPIKPVAEAMGCSVNWVSDTKTVRIASPHTIIAMQIGNNLMTVVTSETGMNSDAVTKTVELAQAPIIINGSSYIPMRPMVEALGGTVEWNGNTKTIKITSSEASGIIYSFDEATGTLTISGSGPIINYGNLPSEYFEKSRPWADLPVKKLIIESGVTHIGDLAFFNLKQLESVEISYGVIDIACGAFLNCSALKSVTIPSSVERIDACVFGGCKSLKSITIPDSVTDIWGNSLFSGCTSLETVTLPKSAEIKFTGDIHPGGMFKDCKSLKTIYCGKYIEEIDETAFEGCGDVEFVYR